MIVPGRNAAGSQPYFPEVPGLTVAMLPGRPHLSSAMTVTSRTGHNRHPADFVQSAQ
jgi:hypothetical protein